MIDTNTTAARTARELFLNTVEGIYEDVSNVIDYGTPNGEWEPVNDSTPQEKLPILINRKCRITAMLAKLRLEGVSITSKKAAEELYQLMKNNLQQNEERANIQYSQGICYATGKIIEAISSKEEAHLMFTWAWLDPYDD